MCDWANGNSLREVHAMRYGNLSWKRSGFTLIELLVVIAIAAVILTLAAPSFAEFQRNARITAAANDLLGAIQTARSEAIKRQEPHSVCPSPNPEAGDAAVCDNVSFLGWIAFRDPNSNCQRDAGEAIRRAGARIDSPEGNPLNALSNGVCISFAATGFLQTDATGQMPATASQTLFCDKRGAKTEGAGSLPGAGAQTYARGIEVSPTGRARVTRDSAEISAWGPDVACPAVGG
jgi:type IV fimbrial biogenesis protein FimT